MSWDEGFASRYDEWASHMTEDVAFYVGLAREAAGPVVELAVGNGRVAVPVAQAINQTVIGIDSSPAMLAQARARGPRLAFGSIYARGTSETSSWMTLSR
jgi:ubiquinone/menaquinone biosynthesis C-methylase UbiE